MPAQRAEPKDYGKYGGITPGDCTGSQLTAAWRHTSFIASGPDRPVFRRRLIQPAYCAGTNIERGRCRCYSV